MSSDRPHSDTYPLGPPDVTSTLVRRPAPYGDLRVDDHVVQPEIERYEMIAGEIRWMSPADLPHASMNGDLDYLLRAHLAPGYRIATDLLTRHDELHDFASDCAVLKDGIDPETGTRYCEVLAFEIVSSQGPSVATAKAPVMRRRGIERVFAIFIKKEEVAEWVDGGWQTLDLESHIEHPSLAKPLPVIAILDASLADDAVARALVAKDNAVIQEVRREGESKGEAKGKALGEIQGKAEAIVAVLEGRGLPVDGATRQELLQTTDLDLLERRLYQAGTVMSAEELLEDSGS